MTVIPGDHIGGFGFWGDAAVIALAGVAIIVFSVWLKRWLDRTMK